MTAPNSFPKPARNWTAAGFGDRAGDLTSSDILYAAGDYTGGASEDLFTLSSHGLQNGDCLHVLWQSAMGAVTGGEGTKAFVKYLSSSTFQLCSDTALSTIIENTADGNVVFVKGLIPTGVVENLLIPRTIVAAWDFTGGTVEDMGTPAQGTHGLVDGDTIKLLYKSAAGVNASAVDTTLYAKSPTVTYFQVSTTSGGGVMDTTADGTAVFIKTS